MAELPNVTINLPERKNWEQALTDEDVNHPDFGVVHPTWNVRTLEYRSGDGGILVDKDPATITLLLPDQGDTGRSLAPIMAWLLPALGVRGELVQLILAALSGEHSPEIIADYLTDWGREEDAAAVRAAIPKSEGN